jgi:hypothetical protein
VIGSYCVSKATGNVTTCSSGLSVPEQINVQIASGSSVVVSWVTFEAEPPAGPPVRGAHGRSRCGSFLTPSVCPGYCVTVAQPGHMID